MDARQAAAHTETLNKEKGLRAKWRLHAQQKEVFEPGSDAMQQLCETRDTIVSLDPAAVGKGSRRQQLVRLRNDIRATLKNVDEQLDTLQPSS